MVGFGSVMVAEVEDDDENDAVLEFGFEFESEYEDLHPY